MHCLWFKDDMFCGFSGQAAPVSFAMTQVIQRRDCKEDISDIKYSPDNRMIAVGSHDNFIDLYVLIACSFFVTLFVIFVLDMQLCWKLRQDNRENWYEIVNF